MHRPAPRSNEDKLLTYIGQQKLNSIQFLKCTALSRSRWDKIKEIPQCDGDPCIHVIISISLLFTDNEFIESHCIFVHCIFVLYIRTQYTKSSNKFCFVLSQQQQPKSSVCTVEKKRWNCICWKRMKSRNVKYTIYIDRNKRITER